MAARRILTLARSHPSPHPLVSRVARAAACALACAAGSAQASPRSDPTTGRAVFTGATMPHVSSIGLAPAALGLGQFDQVYAAITGVIDQLRIDLDKSYLSGADARPRVRAVELSPGAMLAFIYHLAGDQVTLGFSAGTNPAQMFPRGQPALRYHTLGGRERDWLASAGGSIKLANDLFFGASVAHQNTFLQLSYARDTAIDRAGDPGAAPLCSGAPCGIENPEAAERYDLAVRSPTLSTSNLRVNIGAIYQLARDVWIGITYHTPPGFAVETELAGALTVGRAPRDVALGGERVLALQSVVDLQFPASIDGEIRARLPHLLELHVAGRWEDLSRLRAYDVRAYGSTLRANAIPEWTERPLGMHDSFAGWVGLEQVDKGQDWLFGARLGFESSSITAERTSPVTIAPASFTLDLGVQRRIARAVVQLSYGLQLFPVVHTGSSAFDPDAQQRCVASGYDYATAACAQVREGYAIPTAAGDYGRIEHAVRIGLRYDIQ